ncbi:MAG: flagellar biosynthesis protein FlhB [Vulcanimicrobiota bacterium]
MSEEKTEQATEHRKREAIRKGQVVKSQELVAAVTMAVSFAMLAASLPFLVEKFIGLLRTGLVTAFTGVDPLGAAQGFIWDLMLFGSTTLLGMMIASAAAAALLQLAMTGFVFTPGVLTPDLNKLNPFEAIKRWFSKKILIEGVKISLKTAVVFWVCWSFWKEHIQEMTSLGASQLAYYLGRMEMLKDFIWRLIGVQIVFGAADFGYQWWEHRQSLMMTKQEVKEEYKRQEGDPRIKAQRRARARKMLKSSGMQKLDEARVVITNPTHYAVALKYNRDMDAPVVVAKGADAIALEIRKRAGALEIPIVEDQPLARALYKVELDSTIPPALFRAVAEILLAVTKAEDYL